MSLSLMKPRVTHQLADGLEQRVVLRAGFHAFAHGFGGEVQLAGDRVRVHLAASQAAR
ncbi:MAG: hypothetical protein U0547_01960 [Dehalococcoidia bacterium]